MTMGNELIYFNCTLCGDCRNIVEGVGHTGFFSILFNKVNFSKEIKVRKDQYNFSSKFRRQLEINVDTFENYLTSFLRIAKIFSIEVKQMHKKGFFVSLRNNFTSPKFNGQYFYCVCFIWNIMCL